MPKPEIEGDISQLGKLAGVDVTFDGKMLATGLEVLAEREDIAPDRGKVAKYRYQFLALLAETEHQPRLGQQCRPASLGLIEQIQGSPVLPPGPRAAVEAGD